MPSPRPASHARKHIDLRLQTTVGETLDSFVAKRRACSPQVSWRHIARDVYDTTGEDLTGEVLRQWYADADLDELYANVVAADIEAAR